MKIASVFNGVLGPVMRGPSSSHTAGSYHIGKLARDILGVRPLSAKIYFDVNGSYGKVYREQGSDRGFILGLLGRSLLDDEFGDAYGAAARASCEVEFSTGAFAGAVHPNWVKLFLSGVDDCATEVTAASIGGGSIVVTKIDDFPVKIAGDLWALVVRCEEAAPVAKSLAPYGTVEIKSCTGANLVVLQGEEEPPDAAVFALREKGLFPRVIAPVFFPLKGEPPFQSAEELESFASDKNLTLGETALEYECALLGMARDEAMDEMRRRYSLMKAACERVLEGGVVPATQLLAPVADKIWSAGNAGELPFFGPGSKAAVRAMAIMHANSGMEVVCAAPTGGAAGTLPGVILTLEDELNLSENETLMLLWAAAAVGLILDTRATFAAEAAGCQVEIGAGGAMASAACVVAAGGTVRQALDAAAVSFQNTMGSICDPVQGIVEIPCHTRNAAAASAAFTNADIIIGGYDNPIPLDETIDAVYASGKMIPPELRCTSLGGLSLCPSALAMKRRR